MAKQAISVLFLAGFKGDGLKKAQKDLQGVGSQLDKLTKQTIKAGATFAITKAWRGFTTVAENAITQARDLERNTAALGTVFGALAPQMQEFAKGAADIGMSQAEAAKASTFLGSVLKQSGFSIAETAVQTQKLVTLGADLALTYGYDVQEALLGMTALFRGEYDPIEKFGVAMKQSEINSELAAKGLDKLEGAERRLAEQQIRLQLLMERSADAQGAFGRQSGTLAVEQERLQAAINNMLQSAGGPMLKVLAELAQQLVPIVEQLTPVLVEIFADLAGKTRNLVSDMDGLKTAIVNTAEAFATLIEISANVALFIGKNLQSIAMFVGTIIGLRYTVKFISMVEVAFTRTATATAVAAEKAIAFRAALARTGIGLAIVAVAEALIHVAATADDYVFAMDRIETASGSISIATDEISKLEDEQRRLQERLRTASGVDIVRYQAELDKVTIKLNQAKTAAANLNNADLSGLRQELGMTTTAAGHLKDLMANVAPFSIAEALVAEDPKGDGGKVATDYVKKFFNDLKEEMWKQSAALKLENMGASEGLIDSILSSEGWMKIWGQIKNGTISLKALQAQFNATADGARELAEASKAVSEAIDEEYADALKNAEDAVASARDTFDNASSAVDSTTASFAKFFEEFTVLPTTEREIGSFEASTLGALDNIKGMLDDTLASLGDDFRGSYDKLLEYADKEMAAIAAIQRQRDDLATKRSLAEALMEDVRAATVSSGNIVSLFSKAQAAAEKVKATDVIAETIQAGRGLKEFRVTVIRDIVEPLADAAQVVDGFKAIVEKTKLFISNLKTLRALGLDPKLFSQIVEAGVEAGGETAQALVEGGADSVTEINKLFRELGALGADLGEEVAQVMYGSGIDLTNGLIAGIAAQQSKLETEAKTLAAAFSAAFNSMLSSTLTDALLTIEADLWAAIAELNRILAEIEAAKRDAGVLPPVTGGGGGGGGGRVLSMMMAGGGLVQGPGTSTSDSIPAMLSNGEFIMNAAAVRKFGAGFMNAINDGKMPKLAGVAQPMEPSRMSAGLTANQLASAMANKQPSNTQITINVTANNRTGGTQAGQAVVSSLQKYIATSGNTSFVKLLQ
jgi:hypothetical protein